MLRNFKYVTEIRIEYNKVDIAGRIYYVSQVLINEPHEYIIEIKDYTINWYVKYNKLPITHYDKINSLLSSKKNY